MLAFCYFNKRVQDRIDAIPTASSWDEMLKVQDEQDNYVTEYVVIDDGEAATLQTIADAPARMRRRRRRSQMDTIDEDDEAQSLQRY